MKYLLDTNVISELIAKQPSPRVMAWVEQMDDTQAYLSVITIGEIKKGIERLPASARKQQLQRWLEDELLIRFSGRIVAIDSAVMLIWGTLTANLESSGRKLPAMDSLIAATALSGSYCLVTRNEADFAETGVTMLNPWK